MKLKPILESLEDISTQNRVVHSTNTDSLISILESGVIRGSVYSRPGQSAKGEEGSPEVATARTSIPKKELEGISNQVGFVNFIFFKDRIKANYKVKPIAEFPKGAMKSIESGVQEFIEENDIKNIPSVSKFSNELIKFVEKRLREKIPNYSKKLQKGSFNIFSHRKTEHGKVFRKAIQDFLSKYSLGNYYNAFYVDTGIPTALVDYFKRKRREYEERVLTRTIPLDSRLLKIELQKGFTEDLISLHREDGVPEWQDVKKHYDLFKKYENLFVPTKEKERAFEYLKSKAEEKIKKEKTFSEFLKSKAEK